jgi:hypothetical protein
VWMNMDAREHVRLSNNTLTQIKVKKQWLYCCSTFHSSCRPSNNEHKSYPKMSVKWLLDCSWTALFTSVDKHYILASFFVLIFIWSIEFISMMQCYTGSMCSSQVVHVCGMCSSQVVCVVLTMFTSSKKDD